MVGVVRVLGVIEMVGVFTIYIIYSRKVTDKINLVLLFLFGAEDRVAAVVVYYI